MTLLSRSYLGWGFDPSYPGWRVFAEERPVVEERRRARAACDLEGNRAGLGCLEHLRMCLSFAVVTEWACRSVTTSPPMVTTSCLSSTGGWLIQPVRVYVGLK